MQGLHGARQGFCANLDAGGRALCVKGFTQFEQGGPRDDGVGGQRELGFPARGHPFDPLGHRVQFQQQGLAGPKQLCARRRQLGAPRAAIEQQDIERVFDLAHAVGQCAGHHAEFPGRCGHAAQPVNGFNQAQVFRRQGCAWSWSWTCMKWRLFVQFI